LPIVIRTVSAVIIQPIIEPCQLPVYRSTVIGVETSTTSI
jgi:hypothetical protein